MNVIDRSFAAEADRLAKAARAAKKRQKRLVIIAALVRQRCGSRLLCLGDDALRRLRRAGAAPSAVLADLHQNAVQHASRDRVELLDELGVARLGCGDDRRVESVV